MPSEIRPGKKLKNKILNRSNFPHLIVCEPVPHGALVSYRVRFSDCGFGDQGISLCH